MMRNLLQLSSQLEVWLVNPSYYYIYDLVFMILVYGHDLEVFLINNNMHDGPTIHFVELKFYHGYPSHWKSYDISAGGSLLYPSTSILLPCSTLVLHIQHPFYLQMYTLFAVSL